jgi:hypothetical protein
MHLQNISPQILHSEMALVERHVDFLHSLLQALISNRVRVSYTLSSGSRFILNCFLSSQTYPMIHYFLTSFDLIHMTLRAFMWALMNEPLKAPSYVFHMRDNTMKTFH